MSEIHRKPASHAVEHHSQQDSDAEGPEPFAAPEDRQTQFANDANQFYSLQEKGEQRGHIFFLSKPTRTQPHILSTQQRILLHEKQPFD